MTGSTNESAAPETQFLRKIHVMSAALISQVLIYKVPWQKEKLFSQKFSKQVNFFSRNDSEAIQITFRG